MTKTTVLFYLVKGGTHRINGGKVERFSPTAGAWVFDSGWRNDVVRRAEKEMASERK